MKRLKKRYVLGILVVFIVAFAIEAGLQWHYLTEEYEKCMNKEYYVDEALGIDENAFYMEFHDNFSVRYKTIYSVTNGLVCGICISTFVSYLFLLYKLFTSKEKKKILTGVLLVVVVAMCQWMNLSIMNSF